MQFGDQTFHNRGKLRTTHIHGLTHQKNKPRPSTEHAPMLNCSTRVEFLTDISTTGTHGPFQTRVQMGAGRDSRRQSGNNAVWTSIGVLLCGCGAVALRNSRMPLKSNVTAYGRKN